MFQYYRYNTGYQSTFQSSTFYPIQQDGYAPQQQYRNSYDQNPREQSYQNFYGENPYGQNPYGQNPYGSNAPQQQSYQDPYGLNVPPQQPYQIRYGSNLRQPQGGYGGYPPYNRPPQQYQNPYAYQLPG
ncbi:unnamed protein product [Rotaria sp. Silwood1]|nr:unnamed protein product [Rotaria sp. Silwood1]CAF1646864.1 unnamed protein product [Rotaria sp. Silwood1]CAF4541328.1 unnamed protein product [Rotaria sp. Silwood1]